MTDNPVESATPRRTALRFSIRALLYAVALLVAAMATYGPWFGIGATAVLLFPHAASVFFPGETEQRTSRCLLTIIVIAMASLLGHGVLEATSAAKESAGYGGAHWNSNALSLGVFAYREANGHFPPPYSVDQNGRPLHSWRTLILPYIGRQSLYNRLRLDEPYDSPANQAVLKGTTIEESHGSRPFYDSDCPSETHFMAVVGDRTMWPLGQRVSDVPDGADATILLIEVANSGVDWYEPRDLSVNEAIDALANDGVNRIEWTREGLFSATKVSGRRLVATASASSYSLGQIADKAEALAMLTRDGKDSSKPVGNVSSYVRDLSWRYRWGRIWSASLLLALAVLPMTERGRQLLS